MNRYFLFIGYDSTIPRAKGDFSLHWVMQISDSVTLRATTKDFFVNIKNNDGHSPAALAILFNNDVALYIVCWRDADRDIVDNNRDTLLHLACRGNSYDIVTHIAHQVNA